MAAKIFVIDDERLILTAVERALTEEGYVISKAQNMNELDEALRDAPFDLLITDVYMRGTSVDEIISRVRETSPAVKIIRMSGAINTDGSLDFIEKPFSIYALRKKVKDILNEPS